MKNGEGTVSEKYWIEYDLVGADIWEKAQAMKSSRIKPNAWGGKTPSNKATGKGLLVGILKCECGGHMTYSTSSDWADSKRTVKKEPYGIYRCQTRLKQGVAACGAKKATYRVKEYESKVLEELVKFTKHLLENNQIEKIRAKTESATENIKVKINALKQDIERYEKAKNSANQELMNIMMGMETRFNENQLTEIYNNAEAKLKVLEKNLEELESLKKEDNMNEVDIMKLEDYISNWLYIFEFGTQQQKRNLIAAIVEEVQFTSEGIKIKTGLDIPKMVEAITSIKHTAHKEIAASIESLENQGMKRVNHPCNLLIVGVPTVNVIQGWIYCMLLTVAMPTVHKVQKWHWQRNLQKLLAKN